MPFTAPAPAAAAPTAPSPPAGAPPLPPHAPFGEDAAALLASAHRTLAIEARALAALPARLGSGFVAACRLCLACQGRVVVTGMGKSGHVGGKIAATLASTGTPAFFVHPGEASHGDLGMITGADVVLALSHSGESAEIAAILPLVRRRGARLIALTGRANSTLGRAADAVLDAYVEQEACPLNLAPTASTTAALAMGDALAVALLEARGFTAEDFALSHPGGALGKRLLLRVADLMRTGAEVPVVAPGTPLPAALLEMSQKGLGMTVVATGEAPARQVVGVFTDGDLRRAFARDLDVRGLSVDEVMTPGGLNVAPDGMAADALAFMRENRVAALPVIDDSRADDPAGGDTPRRPLVGVLHLNDLLRAGL